MSSIQKIESNIYDAYTKVFYPMNNDDKIIAVAIVILFTIGVALIITNASIALPCIWIKGIGDMFSAFSLGACIILMFKNLKYPEKSLAEFYKYSNELDKLGFIKKEDEPNTLDANSKV